MKKESIAILGRGKSLKKYSKFSYLFNKVYIVGTFHKEIRKIGIKHFKNKEIIHVVGRSDWGWRDDLDKKLNISKVQTMYYLYQLKKKENKKFIKRFPNLKIEFLPEYMTNRGFPLVSRENIRKYSRKYNNYKELCFFFEQNFKEEIEEGIKNNGRCRYWPTNGVFAIDLALMENNDKDCYIFGIDALKSPSYVIYNWEKKREYNQEKVKNINKNFEVVSDLIIYHIKELVKEFTLTEFYSASNIIKIDCSNWNII